MLPQGIFSVAVATVLFPRLSRLAARADSEGFRETVSLGIRQIGFMLIPASARPRRAGRADCPPALRARRVRARPRPPVVAEALAAFTIGLTFNGMMLMLNRAFFSLQSPWIPTWIALGNLALNAGLAAALLAARRLGDPARDLDRERGRHRGARLGLPPAGRTARRPAHRRRLRPHARGLGARRGHRATGCGSVSTRRSDGSSASSSSASRWRSRPRPRCSSEPRVS